MPSVSKLQVPSQNDRNIEKKKFFVFNQTGNIMISSTTEDPKIEEAVRRVFEEVSVFFAGMTAAISTTKNPDDEKGGNYSIYNYAALQQVINGSGLFMHLNQQDLKHTTSSWGADFSKELITGVLGLATGTGALSFAGGMLASMGNEGVKLAGSSSSQESKVANIVFVCEYLLGMPMVSAIVVYVDAKEVRTAFQAGPCFKTESTNTTLNLHKDLYFFTPPTFIKRYSADLLSAKNSPEYHRFVDWLQNFLLRNPVIERIMLGEKDVTQEESLEVNKTYEIQGSYLKPHTENPVLRMSKSGDESEVKYEKSQWTARSIKFSVAQEHKEPVSLGIYANKDAKEPIVSTKAYKFLNQST